MMRPCALTRQDGKHFGTLSVPEDVHIVKWGGSLFAEVKPREFVMTDVLVKRDLDAVPQEINPEPAPSDLARAAQRLLEVIEAAGLHNLSKGVELGPTVWYVKATAAIEWLAQEIAIAAVRPDAAGSQEPQLATERALQEIAEKDRDSWFQTHIFHQEANEALGKANRALFLRLAEAEQKTRDLLAEIQRRAERQAQLSDEELTPAERDDRRNTGDALYRLFTDFGRVGTSYPLEALCLICAAPADKIVRFEKGWDAIETTHPVTVGICAQHFYKVDPIGVPCTTVAAREA